MLSINYKPAFEHPVLRAFAMFLALLTLFPLLVTINHAPHYAGVLPFEFWLIPALLVLSILVWCTLDIDSAGALTLTWKFAGFALKTVKSEQFSLAPEKKYLRLTLDGHIKTALVFPDKNHTSVIMIRHLAK